MINKFTFSILLTLAILILGCECPTNNPNAIIRPTEYAGMLFVNAMPETNLNSLYVFSASAVIGGVDTILYKTDDELQSFKEYRAVGIKVNGKKNTLRLVSKEDTSKTLFNSVLNIQKDRNYTFIAYGAEEDVQSIIVKDYLENPKEENIYIRCFNASPDAPIINLKVTTENYEKEFPLSSGEASEIAAAPVGVYTIYVKIQELGIEYPINNVLLSKGKINNIIFKGYARRNHSNSAKINIVTSNYPFK